jgi:hypothetical protein
MKYDRVYIALIHAMVKNLLMAYPVEEAHARIFRHLFPYTVWEKFERKAGESCERALQRVCDVVYELDEAEAGRASCYSASLVAQALAYLWRQPVELVIGLRRSDQKIFGHAWLEIAGGDGVVRVVSPGRVPVGAYRVSKRLAPEDLIGDLWGAK